MLIEPRLARDIVKSGAQLSRQRAHPAHGFRYGAEYDGQFLRANENDRDDHHQRDLGKREIEHWLLIFVFDFDGGVFFALQAFAQGADALADIAHDFRQATGAENDEHHDKHKQHVPETKSHKLLLCHPGEGRDPCQAAWVMVNLNYSR